MSGSAARRNWVAAVALAAAVVAVDQLTKGLVRGALEPGERVDLIFGIDLALVSNRGIAFGFLGDGGTGVLIVTVVALAAMLAWFVAAPPRAGLWVAVGLLAGGAIGNLIDRLRLDAVTDFIDPPLWPAFNFADIAITFGAVALVVSAIWGDGAERGPG
ncbi:MAG: signal peptidase II [Solirubrobacterales bacterium]